MRSAFSDRAQSTLATALFVGLVAVVFAGIVAIGAVAGAPAPDSSADDGASLPAAAQVQDGVSEEEYVEEVPEEGDPYFEAAANDGSWISYINPRDEYRSPYLGDGSGKMCATLLNENGDPVVGESVPDATVTVPTGDSLEWHDGADPFTVEYPLTENYERPLDADQFGTNESLPQGSGYLDSHCIEFHGLPEDGTIEYGEAQIEGEDAEDIELVGYIQRAHDTWETDIDPLEAAEPYEQAGGWTYHEGGSHGQAVVVLQLDGDIDEDGSNGAGDGNDGSNGGDNDEDTDTSTGTDDGDGDESDTDDESTPANAEADDVPGFGPLVAVVALASALLARRVTG
ncbi:PGF-CTERM sorting domain-containing protein [Halobiforma lacisalsi AJ5]|uniref:PGF-CTERM sorting domain-containing protein n=1 Tax=Natronobacterium lacisalsi AJ5 TaxID=358396 RepID=M0LDJ3_NATLA|nr:PGF-CTERM sorting domain-containing protein [Halobiforma lacisalsi]APW99535.1 PGF-CTERM sorting domain-containing protein [Halobiforma lacisalsi AJ5]EMA31661.1 hypothetical protein C445_14302 [Halobiforma lacisalsi AJ5]